MIVRFFLVSLFFFIILKAEDTTSVINYLSLLDKERQKKYTNIFNELIEYVDDDSIKEQLIIKSYELVKGNTRLTTENFNNLLNEHKNNLINEL